MILETDRLVLRELTMEDLDALQAWQSDARTMRFYPALMTREDTQDWIERTLGSYARNGFGLWAAVLKESGEVIGNIGITLQLVDGEPTPEIGYQLHKDHWGKGLATEAALGCKDYGFIQLDFPRLISWMAPDNWPSRRVAERVGMTFWKEATSPKTGMKHVVYVIDRGDSSM